jgi:hypothetical protein
MNGLAAQIAEAQAVRDAAAALGASSIGRRRGFGK